MQRRKAVIAAATASLTLLAGAAAIGLNTGIVGASGDDGVGQISPVDPASTGGAGVVDEPGAGLTTAPSATRSDDDFDEFENNDRGDDHGDDQENHEYEGADDDD